MQWYANHIIIKLRSLRFDENTLLHLQDVWVTITTDDLKVITRDWCPMAAFTMLHGGEHLKTI